VAKKSKKQKKAKKAVDVAAPGVAAATAKPAVTVRHYCQGIGDCHLLTFPKADGTVFRMLIDCGIHSSVKGGSIIIDEIVADIKAVTGGKIDVLVVTHEHWDHVSGFSTAAEIFKDFTVGEVWMAWTENPAEPLAAQFDKYKGQALAALQSASLKLDAEPNPGLHLTGIRDGLQAILGFQFGATGDKVRGARNAAAKLAGGKTPTYLAPETAPFSIAGVPGLRIYVLGPPRNKTLLNLEERADEMYRLGARSGWPLERALSASLAASADVGAPADDYSAPFDRNLGTDLADLLAGPMDSDIGQFVGAHYAGPVAIAAPAPAKKGRQKLPDENLSDQSWRRIDADWLGVAADLAMQLDRGVNNTSLVLAFELTDSGRVLLFPGDAQVGNWLSWQEVNWIIGGGKVEATDLMARTVYLKVAHHGSQNATLEKKGLELMTSPDLSAFIPTNEVDAKKVGWGEMPYHSITETLAKKTSGRTIRADDAWIGKANGKPAFAFPSGSILAVRSEGKRWVELDLA